MDLKFPFSKINYFGFREIFINFRQFFTKFYKFDQPVRHAAAHHIRARGVGREHAVPRIKSIPKQ